MLVGGSRAVNLNHGQGDGLGWLELCHHCCRRGHYRQPRNRTTGKSTLPRFKFVSRIRPWLQSRGGSLVIPFLPTIYATVSSINPHPVLLHPHPPDVRIAGQPVGDAVFRAGRRRRSRGLPPHAAQPRVRRDMDDFWNRRSHHPIPWQHPFARAKPLIVLEGHRKRRVTPKPCKGTTGLEIYVQRITGAVGAHITRADPSEHWHQWVTLSIPPWAFWVE